jgi:hypothetical protein
MLCPEHVHVGSGVFVGQFLRMRRSRPDDGQGRDCGSAHDDARNRMHHEIPRRIREDSPAGVLLRNNDKVRLLYAPANDKPVEGFP